MKALADATVFETRFSGVELYTTGSVAGDVQAVIEWLLAARAESLGARPLAVLDEADPVASVRVIAAHVEALNVELRQQGFRPPAIAYMAPPLSGIPEDVLGFLDNTAAFLAKIAPLVVEPPYTIH
ncbi:MAG: hypothetical protein WD645_06155 [Dehalococcoidia bacterium]